MNTIRTHKIPLIRLKLAGTQLVLDFEGSNWARMHKIIWLIIPNENIIVKINTCKELTRLQATRDYCEFRVQWFSSVYL